MAKGDELQIRAIVRGMNGIAERVIRKVTLDVTANLIETTPVDTGWARANWVPSISAPFIASLANAQRTPADVSSAVGQQGEGKAKVFGYKLHMGKVFVTNNVPYIIDLNLGSSRQAPAAFVQRAIAKAVTLDIRGFKA